MFFDLGKVVAVHYGCDKLHIPYLKALFRPGSTGDILSELKGIKEDCFTSGYFQKALPILGKGVLENIRIVRCILPLIPCLSGSLLRTKDKVEEKAKNSEEKIPLMDIERGISPAHRIRRNNLSKDNSDSISLLNKDQEAGPFAQRVRKKERCPVSCTIL